MRQEQPNPYSCLATSFAMVLRMPVQDIFKAIGHDGTEIVWPDLPEPFNRRGFHIQELTFFCLGLGFTVTQFDAVPCSKPMPANEECIKAEPYILPEDWESRFELALGTGDGVIVGTNIIGRYHAVAWLGGEVVDPSPRNLGRINPRSFYWII